MKQVQSLDAYCQVTAKALALLGRLKFFLCLMLVLGTSACGSGSSTLPVEEGSAAILVQGSDTMFELMRKWSDSYMKATPGVQITVEDSDTGTGLANLMAGKADIAAASRELGEEETKLAHSHGVHLKRIMVARDALAVIVNPQNKVSELSLEDLAKVYSSQMTNWSDITHNNKDKEPIRSFGREATSGTSVYFREHVLNNGEYGTTVKLMPSSEAVIGGVYGNRLAIGFVGMSQAHEAGDKVKVLKLKLTDASPESKHGGTLAATDYPLSRPLYIYYDGHKEAKVGKFVAYCTGESGQKIVTDLGFMSAH